MKKTVYISRAKLKELLKDPLFVAYAPLPGPIIGGFYNKEPDVLYMIKRGAK